MKKFAVLRLQYVERRWTEGQTNSLEPQWIYRRVRTSERDDIGEAR